MNQIPLQRRRTKRPWLSFAISAVSLNTARTNSSARAFSYGTSSVTTLRSTSKVICYRGNDEDIDDDELFLERFRRRRQQSRYRASARRQLLPPDPAIADPVDFVKAILEALRYDDKSSISSSSNDQYSKGNTTISEESGAYVLLSSSTPRWFEVIRRFMGIQPFGVGVDDWTEEEYFLIVASSLANSFDRVDNQFNILLGRESVPKYMASFPTDPVEQDENTCWLECRLRDCDSDELLVVQGWELKRREDDGAWLIDGLDWQDFRDGFRPGIGREEWERICG